MIRFLKLVFLIFQIFIWFIPSSFSQEYTYDYFPKGWIAIDKSINLKIQVESFNQSKIDSIVVKSCYDAFSTTSNCYLSYNSLSINFSPCKIISAVPQTGKLSIAKFSDSTYTNFCQTSVVNLPELFNILKQDSIELFNDFYLTTSDDLTINKRIKSIVFYRQKKNQSILKEKTKIDKPQITNIQVTNITSNSARLERTINPNGACTKAWFETSLGIPLDTILAGEEYDELNGFPSNLINLKPKTKYKFRVGASNSIGLVYSDWITFTTKHEDTLLVFTLTKFNPNPNSLLFNGKFYSKYLNENITTWFEYGTDYNDIISGKGLKTIAIKQNKNEGEFESQIDSININAMYYYRACISDGISTIYGELGSAILKTDKNNINTIKKKDTLNTINEEYIYDYFPKDWVSKDKTNTAKIKVEYFDPKNIDSVIVKLVLDNDILHQSILFSLNDYYYPIGNGIGFPNSRSWKNSISFKDFRTDSTSYDLYTIDLNILYDTLRQDSIKIFYELHKSNRKNDNVYFSPITFFRKKRIENTKQSLLENTLTKPVVKILEATNITSNSATLNGIVNPNEHITTSWFETMNSVEPLQLQKNGKGASDTLMLPYNLTGLIPGTTYKYRIRANNDSGLNTSEWTEFTTLTEKSISNTNIYPPSIVSATVTNITSYSATLNGIVNPNGEETNAWFQTSESSETLKIQNIQNGTSDVILVAYDLTGLTPDSTYQFRVRASNLHGPSFGEWLSFTTLSDVSVSNTLKHGKPIVRAFEATNITSTSATLIGVVNPNGEETNAWFETPGSKSLGLKKNGIDTLENTISHVLIGLQPNTSYKFRLVASNKFGIIEFPNSINNNNGSYSSVWLSFTTKDVLSDTVKESIENEKRINECGDTPIIIREGNTLSVKAGYSGYLWSNGATTSSIIPKEGGNYFVAVTGSSGCSISSKPFKFIIDEITSKRRGAIFYSKIPKVIREYYDRNWRSFTSEGIIHFDMNESGKTDTIVYAEVMSLTKRLSIANPTQGLLVFDETTNTFWYYDGIVWANLPKENVENNITDVEHENSIIESMDTTSVSVDTQKANLASSDLFEKKKQIKNYNQNKRQFIKQVADLEHNLARLKSDSTYSKIDFAKIFNVNTFLTKYEPNELIETKNQLQSINYLTEDLTFVLKVLRNKRKFKRDIFFIKKYNRLFENFEGLIKSIDNNYTGYNYQENYRNVFQCSIEDLDILSNQKLHLYNLVNETTGKYPVSIKALLKDSSNKFIPQHGLQVQYKYDVQFRAKHQPFTFESMTSPALDFVIPGYYRFWLIDRYKKNKRLSAYECKDLRDLTEKLKALIAIGKKEYEFTLYVDPNFIDPPLNIPCE
jgi:hypothetical protein